MSFATGALVKARGREWVVLPGSQDDLLKLRPLGGTDDEVTGILTKLEKVTPASFDLPDPSRPGDFRSCRLLRDALRLGFRSSAGPFRSFGHLGVEPRPYQLVPLLMALKLDPVRLLIADDVGVGKTVESLLVTRELLDRGEASRLAVLCPPHLAEQWQQEMREKFHLDPQLVLAGTADRLERGLSLGESLFEVYPHVVVSIDFIKSDRRRDEFIRVCPELVIVDEAHGCASGAGRGRQQRHALVRSLAADPDRRLILVTATPHSGKEDAFRSLLELLDPAFADLPDDLAGQSNAPVRRRLAGHLVQRRRADIRYYLQATTPFPKRQEAEEQYELTPEYKRFFERVLDYARETVRDPEGGRFRQRVRWWSVLGLLRALASSPAAAAATLRSRAAPADTDSPEEADEVGRRTVLDLADDDAVEGMDVTPGGDPEAPAEAADEETKLRRRLLDMARTADDLTGEHDAKLQKALGLVKKLVDQGWHPIVFCRFIHTAEYVADALREHLGKGTEVSAVTGTLPPPEREQRVQDLAGHERRVLVATDCLSEGINLQGHFDAVFHYDLTWNPTRHEQREGRVDRFGQPRGEVRVLTYWGTDNQIDGIVLEVLIRKHKRIRSSLGVSVPVPVETDAVVEAIFEGLLLRERSGAAAEQLLLSDELFRTRKTDLDTRWDAAADRERRSRTMFAQEAIRPDAVAAELEAARRAVGSEADVAAFVRAALSAEGAGVTGAAPVDVDLQGARRSLRDALSVALDGDRFKARFDPAPTDGGRPDGELYLYRTHPLVEALAAHVLDTALDPLAGGVARRCGVIRTSAVGTRTTLLLLRYRFDLVKRTGEATMLAEDWGLLAFRGAPAAADWLEDEEALALLEAEPSGNVAAGQATEFVGRVTGDVEALKSRIERSARDRAAELAEADRRVRVASGRTGALHVEPKLPPDLLGVYVYLPVPAPPT